MRDPASPTLEAEPLPPDDGVPAHTLPWWRRFERRSILSLAKRLASPRGQALAGKVPALRLVSRRFLARIETAQVNVCGAPFRLDVMRRSVSRSVYLGGGGTPTSSACCACT